MSWLRRLALVAFVACGVMTVAVSVERLCRKDVAPDSAGLLASAGSPNIRLAELSRRAARPPSDPERNIGLSYDGVMQGVEGWEAETHPETALPRSPTPCHSVEPVPPDAQMFTGPHDVHNLTVAHFINRSGFGIWRMLTSRNDRGVVVASRTVDRVELVSLLTDDEPSVYVLDEMATPPLARRARRRPLDEFERRGLDAVRHGEELVATPEAPTRMFGAIRAGTSCLDCHSRAKPGDLLGAFTYYLNTPVTTLKVRE